MYINLRLMSPFFMAVVQNWVARVGAYVPTNL